MESENKKIQYKEKSLIIWLIGALGFFIGFQGHFNPKSPSPEFFYVVWLISMPVVLVGFIMLIINVVKAKK